jgi:hypothetical protein
MNQNIQLKGTRISKLNEVILTKFLKLGSLNLSIRAIKQGCSKSCKEQLFHMARTEKVTVEDFRTIPRLLEKKNCLKNFTL